MRNNPLMTDVRKGLVKKPLPKTHLVRKDNTLTKHSQDKAGTIYTTTAESQCTKYSALLTDA